MSWKPGALVDGYGDTITSIHGELANDPEQKVLGSRVGNLFLFTSPVQTPEYGKSYDFPENMLLSRAQNAPLTQAQPPSRTKGTFFDLPEKLLGSRTLGLRLFILPDKKTNVSSFDILAPRILESRIPFRPDQTPVVISPWWTQPQVANKWRTYQTTAKWSTFVRHRWSFTIRG